MKKKFNIIYKEALKNETFVITFVIIKENIIKLIKNNLIIEIN